MVRGWCVCDCYGKPEHSDYVGGVPGALPHKSSSHSTMPSLHSQVPALVGERWDWWVEGIIDGIIATVTSTCRIVWVTIAIHPDTCKIIQVITASHPQTNIGYTTDAEDALICYS